MMMLFPVSTDVHDGRIRMAAVLVIAVCVIAHLFVTQDNRRVEREYARIMLEYERTPVPSMQIELDSAHTLEELRTIVEQAQSRIEQRRTQTRQSFIAVQRTSLVYRFGVVPAHLASASLVTYMFLHGGWMHLLGNLLFFYVCGVAMEKYWGFRRFIAAYLACGVFAALVYVVSTLLAPEQTRAVPLVGASGAIAGAMGAFMITHIHVRVRLFYLFLWKRGIIRVAAPVYFGLWFAGQIVSAMLEPAHSPGGVAYAAHIGGFILGTLLGLFLKSEDDAALLVPRQVFETVAGEGAAMRRPIPRITPRRPKQ